MDDLNGTAPVIESGRISLYFSFFSIHFSRFTFLDCGLWEIWLDVLIFFEIFSVIRFIPAPKVYFCWARGAGARGEPKEARGKLASSHSPFPL